MGEIVKTTRLSFEYKTQKVLNDISFTINSEDFVAIIGSNGAGKSTLLKLILKDLNPTSGEIYIFDKKIAQFSKWSKIGYVPQNAAVMVEKFPATVAEIVTANLYSAIGRFSLPGKAEKKLTLQTLALVGMESYAESLIGNLSGGQLQRVLLARALVNNPQLLILDEPTTGVDGQSVEIIYNILHQKNKLGLTIILATHDIARVMLYTKRVLKLEGGSAFELNPLELLG